MATVTRKIMLSLSRDIPFNRLVLTYDLGVETITAESLIVTERRTLYVHPQSSAETRVFTVTRRDRNRPLTLAEALERADDPRATVLVNSQSGRAAVEVPAPSLMLDDGTVERRVRLLRSMERPAVSISDLAHRQVPPDPAGIEADRRL